jgi:hypothetical protein
MSAHAAPKRFATELRRWRDSRPPHLAVVITHVIERWMDWPVDGPRDALTRYTTPLTGSYYFVPSAPALVAFAGDPEAG